MLHPPTIWQSLLEVLLSFSALVSKPGTGSGYQTFILRMMRVKTKGPVAIARGTTFISPQNLTLGRYVAIGAHSRIVAWSSITIGDDFMASDALTLNSGGHDPLTLEPRLQPINIGSRVWCGSNVTICAGVDIGDDVVIGAGSVVIRSLSAGTVAVGVPARPMRTLERPASPRLWSMWLERSDLCPRQRTAGQKTLMRLRTWI
jgi:maltose O-acetyltransferase